MLETVVDFIQRNWTNEECNNMMWEQNENVLDPYWKWPSLYVKKNRVAMWRTEPSHTRGFTSDVCGAVKLVESFHWKRREGTNFIIVDCDTDFKLRTKHVSITVTFVARMPPVPNLCSVVDLLMMGHV